MNLVMAAKATRRAACPDTGDIYTGLDRFGRVKDVRWRNVMAGTDLSRVQYGYDRASNRTWRANPSDPGQHFDWLYGYDGLHRLKAGDRGTLNGTHTGITSPQFAQCWTLDSTGNWQGFRQDDTGSGSWSLIQARTANPVNEITGIAASVGDPWAMPTYDANGNMTVIPRAPQDAPSWSTLSVDQWANLSVDQWSGLPAGPATFTATYDAWNRLVKLSDESGTVQENQYDGRGYRMVRKSYAAGTLAETRHYYYTDNWQVVEERLGSSTTPDRQFVWGVRYVDDLVLRDRSGSGTLDERLYALQDANWNVTAAVDDAGTVQERYEYDPYGVTSVLDDAFEPQSPFILNWGFFAEFRGGVMEVSSV